jgi:hypothetical protein
MTVGDVWISDWMAFEGDVCRTHKITHKSRKLPYR